VVRGWDEGKLAERRYIYAADLDTVAPVNPVWLVHTTGHYGVANSSALKIGGITDATQDPPAGTIDRDAQGKPTGVLKEAATGLVARHVPRLTREQERNGVLKIIEDFNKEGMTGAKDPGISSEKWELYQELLKENRLNVRVFALWRGPRSATGVPAFVAPLLKLPRPPESFGNGLLISGGVKLYMDGSGGARTAWMYEDCGGVDSPTERGLPQWLTLIPAVVRRIQADAGPSGREGTVFPRGEAGGPRRPRPLRRT
jgi:predicted amidohydrolase YtcJ